MIIKPKVVAAMNEQLRSHFDVAAGILRLEHRVAIVLELQPVEPLKNLAHRVFGRALAVGVFDAQAILAAVVARMQPIE